MAPQQSSSNSRGNGALDLFRTPQPDWRHASLFFFAQRLPFLKSRKIFRPKIFRRPKSFSTFLIEKIFFYFRVFFNDLIVIDCDSPEIFRVFEQLQTQKGRRYAKKAGWRDASPRSLRIQFRNKSRAPCSRLSTLSVCLDYFVKSNHSAPIRQTTGEGKSQRLYKI